MRLENPTGAEKRYQFWLNAMVSGPGDAWSPDDLVFLFPTDKAIVHSTDDAAPAATPRRPSPGRWSDSRDLSRYADWQGYLGVFAATPGGRQGAYDPAAQLGRCPHLPRRYGPRRQALRRQGA